MNCCLCGAGRTTTRLPATEGRVKCFMVFTFQVAGWIICIGLQWPQCPVLLAAAAALIGGKVLQGIELEAQSIQGYVRKNVSNQESA